MDCVHGSVRSLLGVGVRARSVVGARRNHVFPRQVMGLGHSCRPLLGGRMCIFCLRRSQPSHGSATEQSDVDSRCARGERLLWQRNEVGHMQECGTDHLGHRRRIHHLHGSFSSMAQQRRCHPTPHRYTYSDSQCHVASPSDSTARMTGPGTCCTLRIIHLGCPFHQVTVELSYYRGTGKKTKLT